MGCAAFTAGSVVGYASPPSVGVDRLYVGLFLVPGALCLLRAVLVREERLAWAAFGVGMVSWVGAETYYYSVLAGLRSPPYPSYSDALWLIAYACTVLGLLALMRSRLRNFRASMCIDAAVGGLVIAAVGAALLVDPILASTGGSLAGVATNLAYPLFDVLIISLVLSVFVIGGGRPGRGWIILGLVFASQCVSDTVYLYQSAIGTYRLGSPLDASWPIYMLIIALVAWQRPVVTDGSEGQGWPALAVTSAFALVGVGLTTYDHWYDVNDVALILATLTLVAAFVRTAMTFADMRTRDARSAARGRALLERNELILNAAGEGICGLDRDGVITFANPTAGELTGWAPDELIGRELHAAVHRVGPGGSSPPTGDGPVAATLVDGMVHHTDRDTYRRRDGSSFAVEVTSTPVVEQDRVSGAVVVFKDISQRQSMEAALRRSSRYFELSRDLVCAIDGDGRFRQVNAAWTRTLGWSESELLLQPVVDFIHPDDQAQARAAGGDSGDGFTAEFVNRYRTKQGAWRWLEWSSLRAREDRLIYASARDITDRKRTEAELASVHDHALEGARLKSEFLANMSHEIRTPLNGVIGVAGLLRNTPLDDEQREYVDAVTASGEALMSLVNDILDLSKIEAGKLELDRHRFVLREVVEDVWSMLATTAHDKNLELVAWVEEDLAETVYGDSVKVRQVLTNFATNAIKFTAAGEVVVRVSAQPLDDGAFGVHFAVTDTGIGLEPGSLERIFEAFAQADSSTTRRYGGTGLGLAISRELVDLMGGRLGVESEPGVGSTFWFTIPLAPVPPDGATPTRPDFKGARVLIADDYLTSRVILDHQLSAWNLECDTVADAAQALRLLVDAAVVGRPYVLAIIAGRPPSVGGMSLARSIRARPALRSTRLLMLSASGSMREAATEAGIDGFLTKPARRFRLEREIGRLLGGGEVAFRRDQHSRSPVAPGTEDERRPVLLAEDNTVNQLVARRMLERRGFRVDLAANGREAVRMHREGDYDLIFMDCQMPDLDGYQATAAIRAGEAPDDHTPIIAMTANTLPGDRDRCIAAGMDDYLGKPLRSTDLETAIARAVATAEHRGGARAPAARLPALGAGHLGEAAGDLPPTLAAGEVDRARTVGVELERPLDLTGDGGPANRSQAAG